MMSLFIKNEISYMISCSGFSLHFFLLIIMWSSVLLLPALITASAVTIDDLHGVPRGHPAAPSTPTAGGARSNIVDHDMPSTMLMVSNKSNINNTIPAIFVFGDSTVDPGNNNYIPTVAKSDFPPYGIDFQGYNNPTGRFTNGKLATDHIASFLGVKDYIPPYLDPTLSLNDLMTGVSFASALSGYDPRTYTLYNVIGMDKQLMYFFEYKSKVERSIGKEKMQDIISKSVFVISCGTNDFSADMQTKAYMKQLISMSKRFLLKLVAQGATKFGVVGMPPIGCSPGTITRNNYKGARGSIDHHTFAPRKCNETMNSHAREYNQMLQEELKSLRSSLNIPIILYADVYDSLLDQIKHPEKYGFEVTDRGCCGTGLLELSILCNPFSAVCPDRSKYVFWDAVHPSQQSYYNCFKVLRPLCEQFFA